MSGTYGYRADGFQRGTGQRNWRYDTSGSDQGRYRDSAGSNAFNRRDTGAYSDWDRDRQYSTGRGTDWYGRDWDRNTGRYDTRGYDYGRSPFDQNGGAFGYRGDSYRNDDRSYRDRFYGEFDDDRFYGYRQGDRLNPYRDDDRLYNDRDDDLYYYWGDGIDDDQVDVDYDDGEIEYDFDD
jgi:hypothetical protein